MFKKQNGVIIMAKAKVDFDIDEKLKNSKKETSVDPFYSESNMVYLKKVLTAIESGEAVLTEHELIET